MEAAGSTPNGRRGWLLHLGSTAGSPSAPPRADVARSGLLPGAPEALSTALTRAGHRPGAGGFMECNYWTFGAALAPVYLDKLAA